MWSNLLKKNKQITHINKSDKGFTLIELLVASAVFAVVMTIVSGSILSVVSANRKSKNLRAVMDNLNLTLENMTRTVRFATVYNCDGGDKTVPRDCPAGGSVLTVLSVDGVRTSYYLGADKRIRILRGITEYYLTSQDLVVDSLQFFVTGTTIYPDLEQPKITITLSGHVGNKELSSFNLQTTITQRKVDFDL